MTTVEDEYKFVVYCEGKSCRQLYYNAAERLEMRPNHALLAELPSKRDMYTLKHLDFEGDQFLGAKGCLAMLDVIRANHTLVTLKLVNQGVDDTFVQALVVCLRDSHQRLETLDLRGNRWITNSCMAKLLELLHCNQMIHHLELEGTNVSGAMRRTLDAKCMDNAMLEADFFKGDYAKLKQLFVKLDTDGSGSITVGELLCQIETPQVAVALEKRFAVVSAQGGSFGMSQFLQYIHPGFASLAAIQRHMTDPWSTDPEETIVENWANLRQMLTKARIVFSGGFQHIRVTARVLSEADWTKVLELALEEEWRSQREKQMSGEGKTLLHHTAFTLAIHKFMGEEEAKAAQERSDAWGVLRLSPTVVKALHAQFIVATQSGSTRPAHLLVEYEAIDIPFGNTEMTQRIHTQTTTVRASLLADKLKSCRLGPSITADFVEWIVFINEQYDVVVYNTYRPDGFDLARCESGVGAASMSGSESMPTPQLSPLRVASANGTRDEKMVTPLGLGDGGKPSGGDVAQN